MKLSARPSIPPYAAANACWNSSAFPVNKTPLAPSAVLLVGMDGFINPPRELTADEINGLIQQFVQTAKIAEQAGFSGVQIHAAHGYLINQFLSHTTTAAETNEAAVWKTYALPFGNICRHPCRCWQRFLSGRKT